MQTVQNKCLKIINNFPIRYSTRQLHVDTNYLMIEEFILKLTNKFRNNCIASPNPLTRECMIDQL